MEDAVFRIFPTLIRKPALGLAVIFDETVAVGIDIALHPVKRSANVRPQAPDKGDIARPLVVGCGKHDEQWRRVHAAVIGSEGRFPQPRHLPMASLMEDSTRFRIPGRLHRHGLTGRKTGERSAGEFGASHRVCQAVICASRPKTALYQGTPA